MVSQLDAVSSIYAGGDSLVIAVDFDGTLYQNATSFPRVSGGKWNMPLINKILEMQKYNDTIQWILWTCREGKEVDIALEALQPFGIKWDSVNDGSPMRRELLKCNPRKVIADLYIDDRAANVSDALMILEDFTH